MINEFYYNVKLTKTEKRFIKLLVESKEINYSTIAEKLGISKQAVSKIKRKLEEKEVLEGVRANINVWNIGISLYSLIILDLGSDANILEVIKYLKSCKNVVYIMESKFPNDQIIVYSGFKNIRELEKFNDELKTNFSELITKKSVKIIYPERIHKCDYCNLVLHSIEDDEKPKFQIEKNISFKPIQEKTTEVNYNKIL